MKNIIITAILSAMFTAFCFHAYLVYQVRNVAIQNTNDIKAIVEFINRTATTTKQ